MLAIFYFIQNEIRFFYVGHSLLWVTGDFYNLDEQTKFIRKLFVGFNHHFFFFIFQNFPLITNAVDTSISAKDIYSIL